MELNKVITVGAKEFDYTNSKHIKNLQITIFVLSITLLIMAGVMRSLCVKCEQLESKVNRDQQAVQAYKDLLTNIK